METKMGKTGKYPFRVIYFFLCDSCRESIFKLSKENEQTEINQITPVLCEECHKFFLNAWDVLEGLSRRTEGPNKKIIAMLELKRSQILGYAYKKMGLLEDQIQSWIRDQFISDGTDDDSIWQDDLSVHSAIEELGNRQYLGYPTREVHSRSEDNFNWLHGVPTPSANPGPKLRKPVKVFDRDPKKFLKPYGWTFRELNQRRPPETSQ
jgi:hypothetical protein